MIFVCGAFGFGLGLFIGYSQGWMAGFERSEGITKEMDGFWKEVEQHGLRNDSPKIVFSAKP
jgi:hypothetical protein